MDKAESLFLEALRYGLAGAPVPWTEPPGLPAQKTLARLARAQAVTPLIAQALFGCSAMAGSPVLETMRREARQLTIRQATRTAEFLLLLRDLDARGLRPLVLKGAVCRSLYPEPEQRPSVDEDLLIPPGDFPAYHAALLAYGLRLMDPEKPTEGADEVPYVDPERELYLEMHLRPFPPNPAVRDFALCLDGALTRAVSLELYGQRIETLHPTDHLLYLLCHAYKHILYGGVGIRQICDICLYARRFAGAIDWQRVRRACGELRIETLSAAFFRVGERWLGIPAPEQFAELRPDEEPLLHDCLTGGLYGANDPDRLHSSTLTLEAAAAEKCGRRRHGALRAIFPPVEPLSHRFPYLRKHSWLLPVAWAQRILQYLREKGSPARSLQIGEERIALLRRYRVLE